MVKSGLSSSGSGSIYIKPKDELNDGAYLRMKVDGEMTEVDITALLIRDATVKRKGVVHFADDTGKEKTKGKAVQASDRRLKPATTAEYGIVRLATSGERTPSLVVQGNDSRLSDARNPLAHKHGTIAMVTFLGDDSEKVFSVEHDVKSESLTPIIMPMSAGAAGAFYQWDDRKIYFIYQKAPPKDMKLAFSWFILQ
jgi:hypothetical protein